MTSQIAPSPKCSEIDKLQAVGRGVRRDDTRVKVYQMRIVRACALSGTNSVRVVACRTRSPLVSNMCVVFGKTRVAVDIVAAMALVAQRVSKFTLGRRVGRGVIEAQQRRIIGAVRTLGAGRAV